MNPISEFNRKSATVFLFFFFHFCHSNSSLLNKTSKLDLSLIYCCSNFFFFRSQQFPCNFSTGFSQPITAQPLQTVSLLTPQSPNGHIPASGGIPPTATGPVQLIEYNGVPTLVFGTTMYDHIYYSPASYVPSPTLSPPSSVATSFTYQTVAPQSPPFNSLNGQQFFPTHVEIIGQPQL